jgi:hypothetical protein
MREHGAPAIALAAVLVCLLVSQRPGMVDARPARASARIVISANAQGVLEPCGCQGDNGGGFPRRAAALAAISGGASIKIEAGNLMGPIHSSQSLFNVMRQLLQEMSFDVQVLGPTDLRLGAKYLRDAGQTGVPLLISNVRGRSGEAIGKRTVTLRLEGRDIELLGVVDPEEVRGDLVGEEPEIALAPLIRAAVAKRRLVMLVSHLPRPRLDALLSRLRGVDVAVTITGGEVVEQRPGTTRIVPMPVSGKVLTTVDVGLRGEAPPEVRHGSLELPPTMAGDDLTRSRIRAYSRAQNLPVSPASPLLRRSSVERATAATQDGARSCGSCHAEQQAQWSGSKHAHAWSTLKNELADRRAECVGCHTTPLADVSFGQTMSGVGCTTCHRGGFEHASRPNVPGLIVRNAGVDTGGGSPGRRLCCRCRSS